MADKKIDKFKTFVKKVKTRREQAEARKDHFNWSPNDLVKYEAPKKLDEATFKGSSYDEPADHTTKSGTFPFDTKKKLIKTKPDDIHTLDHDDHLRNTHGREFDKHIFQYKISSSEVNRHLRDVPTDDRDKAYHELNGQQHKDHIAMMDHITNVKSKKSNMVYRGFGGGHDLRSMKPGDKFVDHGYTSTSHDPSVACKFADAAPHPKDPERGGTLYHIAAIHLPKGTRGHFIDKHSANVGSEFTSEKEHVLHRGTKFEVLGHAHYEHPVRGRLHVVHMKAVGNVNHND